MKSRLSNNSFEFIDHITIKYKTWNTLVQKGFQANIVFNEQFYTIKSACFFVCIEGQLL